MSRRLLGASIRGMILPRRRGSLLRRLWLTAAVLGPVIYLGSRGRAPLQLLGTAARDDEPAKGQEWRW